MTQLGALLWAKLRIARNLIASVQHESKLKVAVVSVAAVLLWVGAFYGFYRGFLWLQECGVAPRRDTLGLGDIIMARLLSVFSLALFFMLLFSNVYIAYSTLYRSREVAYLIQAPVPIHVLFLARFVECVFFSSWASAFLGSPLILAYGITTQAPLTFYFAATAFYVPFVTVPAALGSLVAMGLVCLFPRLPRAAVIAFVAVTVGALFVYLRTRFNVSRLAEDALLPTVLQAMSRTQSPLLPSYWASRGVLDAAERDYGSTVYHFLLLLSNALMLSWGAAWVASRAYYPGWSLLTGSVQSRSRTVAWRLMDGADRLLVLVRQPARALVSKDIRLFWRDPTQWSQFVIFFGVMAVYIANLRNTWSQMYSDVYRSWVACLNIGACTLILATLTSRFVFPLVSLEGRRIWVLGLAPITFRQLMWQKFWLSVFTTSAFTIGLVVFSCLRLRVDAVPFVVAVYSIVVTNFGLSGLAVGLGSLYPNFHEDNPARIVSGMGGTLNFLLSMAYLVLVVGAETLILQWRVLERYASPGAFWWALSAVFAFVTFLSAAATLIPMRLGLRNLEAAEF